MKNSNFAKLMRSGNFKTFLRKMRDLRGDTSFDLWWETRTKVFTERQALLLSIRKWELIVKALESSHDLIGDGGQLSCGLCWKHLSMGCSLCPIFLRTKQPGCASTPYEDFYETLSHQAAQQELAFLQTFLPEST